MFKLVAYLALLGRLPQAMTPLLEKLFLGASEFGVGMYRFSSESRRSYLWIVLVFLNLWDVYSDN